MELEKLIAAYAKNVTAFRFGRTVKVVYMGHLNGWRLYVESAVSAYLMNWSDGFLYQETKITSEERPQFVTQDLGQALAFAEAVHQNLGEEGRVVVPGRQFISRFLNPISFERQRDYWLGEGNVGEVKAR